MSETVRGLPGRRQQGEEPGGRPLTLSPAVWREAGPHRELPARRAVFPLPAQAAASLAEVGRPLGLRWRLCGSHRTRVTGAQAERFLRGGVPPGPRGRALSHLQAHAVSSAIPPSAPRPLRTPPRLPRGAVTPRRGCPVTPALHSARPFTLLAVAVISSPSPWPRDACLAAYPAFKGIPRQLTVLMLL